MAAFPLLRRSTRRQSRATFGATRNFTIRCAARVTCGETEEAERATQGVDSLHGVVRLAMPVLYGVRAIVPALATFLARHPHLRVEIIMNDARQNLIADGIDVAIRFGIGPLKDSSFGARRLALVERLVVAAPAYLSVRGVPAAPAELSHHDCIVQHGLFGRESWRFTHDGMNTSVDVAARLSIS